MKGVRTYVALALIILNNILTSMGFVQYSSQDISTAVDVILAIMAFFFRYLSDKDAAPK